MNYEVELKYRVQQVDDLRSRLHSLGAEWLPVIRQSDLYFAHPQRDFAVTDEAFRLRSVDREHWLTYKGPLVDSLSKTRPEVEISLAAGDTTEKQVVAMLRHLGFREVRRVVKVRHPAELSREGWHVHLALDDVEELGWFVEIEILADEVHWKQARDAALRLASELSLTVQERRSYLELLLILDEPL